MVSAGEQDRPLDSVVQRRRLLTVDGVRIETRYLPPLTQSRSDLAYVIAHGFTGHWGKPAVQRVAAELNAYGAVLVPDLRGHGGSGGVSTVGDLEVHDIDAAVMWARALGHERVVTLGFSMGASIVVRHAALCGGIDAVAAVSGPARWYYRGTPAMRRVHWLVETPAGRSFARRFLGTRIGMDGWDPIPQEPREVAASIAPIPLLVVHGDADRYFPVDHGDQLAAAGGEGVTYWLEQGFGHAEAATTPELLGRIASWLEESACRS